jgi:uncharacterized protein involved in exopolysaccharide biosynthesis
VTDLILREDYNNRLLNTYAEILTSEPILEKVVQRFPDQSETLTVGKLRDTIEVAVVPDTELITISVENRDPVLARDIANELSLLLIEYARDLYVGNGKSTRDILAEQLDRLETELKNDRYELASLTAAGADESQLEALVRQIEFKENSYDRLLDQYEVAQSCCAQTACRSWRLPLCPTPINALGLMHIGLGLRLAYSVVSG